MNLEVVGRHAILFDDDAMALFVNSADALVDWNSLAIDRYDVRHLLSGPPPLRKRRSPPSDESDLDYERWLDLPSTSEGQQLQRDSSISLPSESVGAFHNVGYAYEDSGELTNQKGVKAESEESHFIPPFAVPENLIHNLPPNEKVHQIIARTAKFVSEHGGQSEVILRVKQGNNPTFGFLIPDHHLHAYFRFLIDHQELLIATISNQEVNNSTLTQNESGAAGNGALSLLSSLYGTEEDDEGAQESTKINVQRASKVTDAHQEVSKEVLQTGKVPVVPAQKDSLMNLHSKEKVLSKRRSNQEGVVGTSKSVKKANEASSKQFSIGTMEKPPAPDVLEMPKPEAIILEPPSDIKKWIDKIVEFVQRNGKEVENVLREQDVKHGRFPFLISSNLYHPYYLKMLQKTQESAATEKSAPKKDHSERHGKKTAGSKEGEALSTESVEFPFDVNRKEKFTMVLGKSKVPVKSSKAPEAPSEVGMDTTAIAAILQAATRGAKLPSSMMQSKSSVNGSSQNVDGQASSVNYSQKQDLNQLRNPSVPLAKNIAKTAALAAASEADSSEASMTKEQQLKADRLKRAKMFAAMIKGGGASIKTELIQGNSEERPESGASGLVRGFSVDRPESGASLLVGEAGAQAVKEREGSSILPDVGTLEEIKNFEMKVCDDQDKERRSKRSYRSKSNKNDGTQYEVSAYRKSILKHRFRGSDEESADDEVEGHSRKKHRSSRYRDENVDLDENGDKAHSRKKHRSHRYDDENDDVDENGDKAHSRKRHKSHRSSHHSKEGPGYGEEHSSKHRSRRDRRHSSDDDDDEHDLPRSNKKAHKKRQSPAQSALESASNPDETTSASASEIPDELRVTVRAMLLANL